MNLLLIQTAKDGTKARTLISFEGDNAEDEAISRLYSECSYASATGSPIAKIVAEIINDEGHVKKCERWGKEPIKEVPERTDEGTPKDESEEPKA